MLPRTLDNSGDAVSSAFAALGLILQIRQPLAKGISRIAMDERRSENEEVNQ